MKLWPDQERVAGYDGGRLAVMAVPGSGKTTSLASIAARLIAGGAGEILIVTYQNGAVTNLRGRVDEFLADLGLPPAGFHVATLHSLAYTILSEHGERIGFDDEPTVLSEDEASQQLALVAEGHYSQYEDRWSADESISTRSQADRLHKARVKFIRQVGRRFASWIKYQLIDHGEVERVLQEVRDPLEPLAMGCWLYREYQRRLDEMRAVDFDDLACQAEQLLSEHPDVTAEYQRRWSYVLEDEAQDSVSLQERMLAKLAGEASNWIRVGDSNQSIMGTFTSADPAGFRRFFHGTGVQREQLRQAARNSPAIASIANHLVDWARRNHPVDDVRRLAFEQAEIQVVTEDGRISDDDPTWSNLRLDRRFHSFDDEAQFIGRQWAGLQKYLLTGAVLVPTNWLGYRMVDLIRARGLECDQLLGSDPSAQMVIEVIASAIAFFAEPHRSRALAKLFERCLEAGYWQLEPNTERTRVSALLRSNGRDLLSGRWPSCSPELLADLEEAARFAGKAIAWLRAAVLPIDELIATVVIDLRMPPETADFGTDLARYLGRLMREHPEYGLTEVAGHLNGRRVADVLVSVSDSNSFVYQPRGGIITVSTYHRAKGLEWDVVYLTGLNEWHFPSDSGSKFFEDNGGEEYAIYQAIADMSARLSQEQPSQSRPEIEYIAERLRLLYVGITRAKKALSMSSHQFSRPEDEGRKEPLSSTLAQKVLNRYVERESRVAF